MGKTSIKISSKETAKKAIIAIGEELKRRAEDITNDLEWVDKIKIEAELNPLETVKFEITKEYITLYDEGERDGYKSNK